MQSQRTQRTDNQHDYANDAEGSFISGDAIVNPENDLLILDDGCVGAVIEDMLNDDIDDTHIQWDKEFDFIGDSSLGMENVDALKNSFESVKGGVRERTQCHIDLQTLNGCQQLAHDMIVKACCLGSMESKTDGGAEIGRLQLLLGAGGCGKSYLIDAVLSSMCHDHGWISSNYCVFATTGKAASSIDGSTVQNYTTGLCYFSGRAFKLLSSNLLQKFQARMKNMRLVIIDEFSMLAQGDLHIIDECLQKGKNSDLLFGGIVVVLCGESKGIHTWRR